ncbi:MAG: hypothetical protein C0425_10225 [Chlorobiaceae bacterium]|nr:hypothetical protein [Chlorobiaceae bacterium]
MLKILIIDDDEGIRIYLNNIVKKGFAAETCQAENGLKGLGVMRHEKPDIILLDISMPVMDGLKTLFAIRSDKEFNKTPVIILTANSDKEDIAKLLAMGISDYILKPLVKESVLERIKKVLEKTNLISKVESN